MRALIAAVALLAACADHRVVHRDPATGFAVAHNQRLMRGIGLTLLGVLPLDGDRGEPGRLHPAVIEYVLGAAEGPIARYYALLIEHPSPPERARRDIQTLAAEAARVLPPGAHPSGVDYARALGRLLAEPINRALSIDGRFGGSAGLYWGVAADLESRVLLAPSEREHDSMRTVVHRFERTRMVVVHSSGLHSMLAWDLSAVPGAFDPGASLDYRTVASRAVPLHPEARR